jgi:phospholipase/carboxylesterase
VLGLNNHSMTYNGWTLRVRHATQQPSRLLLMLHGWTGDENSMWIFARKFPDNFWIAAPRALHPAQEGGYSWRVPPPKPHGLPSLVDLKPAADALIRLVNALSSSWGVDASQFDVVGFSQGGALANVVTLLYPGRIRRAAVLAGFMPGGTEKLIASRVLDGKPFFVAHGTQDELITVEQARDSIKLLEQAGAQVIFCEAEVGHKVSRDCLSALESFFI